MIWYHPSLYNNATTNSHIDSPSARVSRCPGENDKSYEISAFSNKILTLKTMISQKSNCSLGFQNIKSEFSCIYGSLVTAQSLDTFFGRNIVIYSTPQLGSVMQITITIAILEELDAYDLFRDFVVILVVRKSVFTLQDPYDVTMTSFLAKTN